MVENNGFLSWKKRKDKDKMRKKKTDPYHADGR